MGVLYQNDVVSTAMRRDYAVNCPLGNFLFKYCANYSVFVPRCPIYLENYDTYHLQIDFRFVVLFNVLDRSDFPVGLIISLQNVSKYFKMLQRYKAKINFLPFTDIILISFDIKPYYSGAFT